MFINIINRTKKRTKKRALFARRYTKNQLKIGVVDWYRPDQEETTRPVFD